MKFRKKPVVIEAVQFTGHNAMEIMEWSKSEEMSDDFLGEFMEIKTLEGTMRAENGDWIIKGVKGEFYPCKPDIFEATYEPVIEYSQRQPRTVLLPLSGGAFFCGD